MCTNAAIKYGALARRVDFPLKVEGVEFSDIRDYQVIFEF